MRMQLVPISLACIALVLQTGVARADSSLDAGQLQGLINQVSSEAAAVGGSLDPNTKSQLDTAIFRLQNTKNEVDRLISALGSLESLIRSEEGTVLRLRIEWETAQHQFDQFKSRWEQDARQLKSERDAHQRVAEIHNAKDPSKMSSAELEAWNAEATRGNARKAAVEARWADLLKELGTLTRLMAAASSKQKNYILAKSEMERNQQQLRAKEADVTATINGAMQTANSLLASVSGARRAARASQSGARSYRTAPLAENVQAVPIAPGFPLADKVPLSVQRQTFVSGSRSVDRQTASLVTKIRTNSIASTLSRYQSRPVGQTAEPPPQAAPPSFDSTRLVWSLEGADTIKLDDTLHPGSFISRADYDRAVAARNKYLDLEAKLVKRIDQLRAWRKGTLEYQEEVEKMRTATIKESLTGFLEVLTDKKILNGLIAKQPDFELFDLFKNKTIYLPGPSVRLTKEQEDALFVALHSAKALLAWDRAETSEQKAEKMEDLVSSASTGIKVLEKASLGLSESHPVRKKMEILLNLCEAGAKIARFVEQQRDKKEKGSILEPLGAGAALLLEVGGLFIPLIATGVASERGLEGIVNVWMLHYDIDPAREDLSAALRANYDAEFHLQRQLERTRAFIQEAERTITSHDGLPPARREVGSLR